ncbi:hypothetical protein BT96DRAFT_941293 [Gymnopus androsaceus JB14]|uniref:Uncharacterized protein n=1 Tax=Gymnopus androsaceus JB14 TaxID=1447944 RepID=A0A6A4HHC5_9AGAR|nr:hypothetical protein BT96DRAFT_941293 [Gymnopus androsaceus JB14]
MYSCRQVYTEMLESIDRHGGVSFELDLAVIKTRSLSLSLSLDNVNSWKRIRQDAEEDMGGMGGASHMHTRKSLLSFLHPNQKCRNMRVSFRIQSETRFWWWGTIGPGPLTKQLCKMITRFLLHGPLGLPKDSTSEHKSDSSSGSSSRWSIDTLSIEIISGIGTTYTNPYNGQSFTVPSRVVEDAERGIEAHLIGNLCLSGALSGRIRVVRLLVDGKVKRECVVDPEKKFSPREKSDWALYGCHWAIE